MRKVRTRLLLNRTVYDVTEDLSYIREYMSRHGVDMSFDIVHTDITGYSVSEIENPFKKFQYVLSGAEPLVLPYAKREDDICVLVVQGFREFGTRDPSESATRQFLPGTNTIFCVATADDPFQDQVPNFRIWIMHELMHALCHIAVNGGYDVTDSMDVLTNSSGQVLYYFMNYSPDDVNGNFVRTWESLYSSGFLRYV